MPRLVDEPRVFEIKICFSPKEKKEIEEIAKSLGIRSTQLIYEMITNRTTYEKPLLKTTSPSTSEIRNATIKVRFTNSDINRFDELSEKYNIPVGKLLYLIVKECVGANMGATK